MLRNSIISMTVYTLAGYILEDTMIFFSIWKCIVLQGGITTRRNICNKR